jgi:hypothetical protein
MNKAISVNEEISTKLEKTHRQAEAQQFCQRAAAWQLPVGEQLVRLQHLGEQQVAGSSEHREPADDGVRDAAAKDAERFAAPAPGDQQPCQQRVQEGAGDADDQQGRGFPRALQKAWKVR